MGTSALLTVVSYAERAVGLIAQLALVRLLAVSHYGAFTSASVASLLISFLLSGSAVVLVTALADRPEARLSELWSSVRAFALGRSGYWLVSVGLLGLIAVVFPVLSWFPLILVLGVGVGLDSVLTGFRHGLFAVGRLRGFVLATVGFAAIRFAGLFLGALWTRTALGAAVGSTAASAVALLAVAAASRGPGSHRNGALAKTPVVLRDSPWLVLAAVLSFLYFREELWIVHALLSVEAAGTYGVSLRLHEVALALPAAYGAYALRRVSRALGEGGLSRGIVARLIRGGMTAGGLAFAGILAAQLLDFGFLFGSSYAMAAPLLRLSVWLYLPIGLSIVLQSLLLATDQWKSVSVSLAIAVVTSLVVSVLLVSRLGLPGAAMAKVITECVLVLSLARQWGFRRPDAGLLSWISLIAVGVTLSAALLVGWSGTAIP